MQNVAHCNIFAKKYRTQMTDCGVYKNMNILQRLMSNFPAILLLSMDNTSAECYGSIVYFTGRKRIDLPLRRSYPPRSPRCVLNKRKKNLKTKNSKYPDDVQKF